MQTFTPIQPWMKKGQKVKAGNIQGVLTNIVPSKVGNETVVIAAEMVNDGCSKPRPVRVEELEPV